VVDSPLAVNVSDIFRKHPHFFDEEAWEFINSGNAALNFDDLTYIRSVEESRALNDQKEPMVIISASGMAESGRIIHHLAQTVGDPRNTILIISYQAPNTNGRRLASGEKTIELFGEPFTVKAQVENVRGFSAHAGQSYLLEYGLASKDRLKGVFLVHTEEGPGEVLQERLKGAGLDKVAIPYQKQGIELV
jgi:metallo-beta-lactamase family protein